MGLVFLQSQFLIAIPVSILLAILYMLQLRKSVAIRVTGERFEVLKAAAVQRGTAGHFIAPILLIIALLLLGAASADPLWAFGGGATFLGPLFTVIAGVFIPVSILLRRR